MTVTNKNIDNVMKIIRRELTGIPEPSVTMVGKKWKSAFHVLISCILSLRTKDSTTLPASLRLFALADSPDTMRKLPVSIIEKAIYPVGFYRTKARNIVVMCDDIMKRYGGKVPDNLDELLTLKGVGRKTANLVLTDGFGKLGVCVDTHVHRISNRFGYLESKDPEETEMILRKILPKKHWIRYNTLLVSWGQNVCKPISPLCSKCAVNIYCDRIGVSISR